MRSLNNLARNRILVFMGLISLFFSIIPAINGQLIIIEKSAYQPGELVEIKTPSFFSNYSVTIRNGFDIFRVLGDTSGSIKFIPEKPGKYDIEFYNLGTNMLIENLSFYVDAANAALNQGFDLYTDKLFYLLGQQVSIFLNEDIANYKLTIISNDESYKYFGANDHNIHFYPRKPGIYNIGLFDNDDNLISSSQFEVYQNLVSQTFLVPSNSKQYVLDPLRSVKFSPKIKNSKGQLMQSVILIDGALKLNTFSSSRDVNEFAETLDFVPTDKFIQKIRFNDINLSNGFNLGIEELPVEKADVPGVKIKRAFAIDPTKIDFSTANVTFIAEGVELYKCALWNFTAQVCYGKWAKIMDLTPGLNYSFTITPDDPAYGQSSYNADACYDEFTASDCGITNINADDTTYYEFSKRTGSPLRVSFPNEPDLIDEIVQCTVHVKAWDSDANTWNLQLGNYSSNTWGTASGQTISTAESDHTWDCLSYFSAGSDDESRYDTFGIRLATTDTGRTAIAYIDHVWVYINYSIQDLIAPVWSNAVASPTSPLVYLPTRSYKFNVTWTDNDAVDKVKVQHNFTGTFQTYDITGNAGPVYYYDYGPISAGSYVWRMYANDTSGNINDSMQNRIYIITKASSSVNLLLNSTDNNITINETQFVNISAYLITGQGNINLYLNGVLINSGTSSLVNITQFNDHGIYNATVRYLESANYTSSYETHFIIVKDVTPPNDITDLHETINSTSWILWNWTNPIDSDFHHIEVWLNGTFKANVSAAVQHYNMSSLFSDTSYQIQVRPVDDFGNIGRWTNDSSRTAASADTTPPAIFNVLNISITDHSANITWDTDESSNSKVFYGLIPGIYTNISSSVLMVTDHNIYLSGLKPSATYYYAVNSTDSAGNSNQSIEYSFTTLPDQTPPIWSNPKTNPVSPATYSKTGNYYLNVTWKDNVAVSKVIIEHDFNGIYYNYSVSGNISDVYYYNYGPMSAGTYHWRMHANDTLGNKNKTNLYTYTINKRQSNVSLFLNASQNNLSINEKQTINITGMLNDGETKITLWIGAGLINNGTSPLTNITTFNVPGIYQIKAEHPETQNYTFSSKTYTLTVNDTIAPNVTLVSPEEGYTDIDGDIVFYFNVTDSGSVTNCSIYINGTLNKTKTIFTQGPNTFTLNDLKTGNYNWQVSCNDTYNHKGVSGIRNFSVFINEFYPQIYPVLCLQETGICNVSLINISDTLYQEHSWVDKQDPEDFVYFNFTNPGISAGATVHWMNFTHQKYQQYGSTEGFYEMYWKNTSSGTWQLLCQQTALTTTTPPSYDTVRCNFNTTTFGFPTISQINAGLQLRARFYYSGSDAANKYYGTNFIQVYLKYTEDVTPPTIELINPLDGEYRNKGSVKFEYRPDDNNLNNCTIWGNFNGTWQANNTNTTPIKNQINSFYVSLAEGTYLWNVMCYDVANNYAFASQNYTVNITNPDIKVLSSYINFSSYNPVEGQNITLFATVKNVGNVNATASFKVQFFNGDPLFGGVQINGNKTVASLGVQKNITLNVSYVIPNGGPFNIFVLADVPLSTNGTVKETDETNNKANRTFHVSGWQTYYGNITADFILGKIDNTTVIKWNKSSPTGKIYIAEEGVNINWLELQALSRRTDGSYASNDFAELDSALSMTNYNDSINKTFIFNGLPKETGTFSIYSNLIADVPIINSTNNDFFKTGILWDYGDGGLEYNGLQDVVFFTELNPYNPGKFGTYAFEISFPVNLENYLDGSSNSVVYYYELE